ncbi:MAG: hypothetical protein KUG78_19035 [Kangiellaceae bacterium]|nr:hypothetical protein [Kangiellaceae bacterium]
MRLKTSLIMIAICASVFFVSNTFAQSSRYSATNNQEQMCRSSLQGRIAFNQAGDKRWQTINLDRLCKGTSNALATVNCFKAQIRNHNNWVRGINACNGNSSAARSLSSVRPSVTRARPPRARPPRAEETIQCIAPDCYASADVEIGAIKDFGPFLTIDNVKYGYHCGDGRNSDKKALDAVDAACKFHDDIRGGDRPFKKGLTLLEFCSRQVRFVAKLNLISSRTLTPAASRARAVILEQFPPTLVPVGCAVGSTGELAVNATKQWGKTAVKDTKQWGKTAVKDTGQFGKSTLTSLGILGTSANEWRVEIDSCHKNLDNEGTKDTITVEFWSKNKKVKSQSRRGVKPNCILNREFWSINSNYTMTHVIVKTSGVDGFFIDEVELFKGGKSRKRHGRDNGRGWCLSKDPKDGSKGWRNSVKNGVCLPQKQYNYR